MAEDSLRIRLLQKIQVLQADYRDAMKAVENLTPDVAARLYAISTELGRYDANDPPHKAVYVVSRCMAMLESFARCYRVIEDYREAQQKLEEYDMRRTIEHG